MLKVFYGSDQIKVRQQAHLALAEALTPQTELYRLEGDNYESGQLLLVCKAVSLFSSQAVYLLEAEPASEILYEDFLNQIEDLANSIHIFVVIAGDLLAADKKKIAKLASVMEEYKKVSGSSFNPFKMADALAVRDKKNLWLLLQEAKQNGLSAEEIIGTLWWQLKAIRLAAATKNFAEAGMKEYPYKKAKSALNTFNLRAVEEKSHALLKLYHEGHQGLRDLDLALEEWVLKL